MLGKTLVMWMSQPNVPTLTTRGNLGFTQNPQQQVDLVYAIDTAFAAVEKAMPECVSQTSAWRAQKGWVTMINDAISQLNAEHPRFRGVARRTFARAEHGRAVRLHGSRQPRAEAKPAPPGIDYFKQPSRSPVPTRPTPT